MGKVSPKEKTSKSSKRKRRINSSNKYLKPGALAQIRNNKVSTSKSCIDIGKKKIDVMDTENTQSVTLFHNYNNANGIPIILSPEKFTSSPVAGPLDLIKENNLPRTPTMPQPVGDESVYESRLESLPMELLVKIVCHLHHDQLRAVFHVSERVRKAAVIARQFYFNYTTPDRSRQEMLCMATPLPTERWPFVSKGDGRNKDLKLPSTPKAPRHGPRPPSRLKLTEMRQFAAVLFQESAFPPRYIVPSIVPKPIRKPFASNRVLFYDEELELCQAVAQNKLR
ncbi:F-box protein At4g35930-like [Bidens hawaiensis]|uniref:F-box protein At4g35930-like n=1 Tax=Bidens hawaiensis TaxID=980011 RepID=UPI00404B97FA